MANYGKYYIAVQLLLLKHYLEANAGKNRIVSRRDLKAFLKEHDMGVEKKTILCGLPYSPRYIPQNRPRKFSLLGSTSSFSSSKTHSKTQKQEAHHNSFGE